MSKLIATRGFSGSGKSFWASRWLAEDLNNRVVTNRDDLRQSLFASDGVLSFDKEKIITKVQQAIVVEAVKAGKDVCLSDTNLKAKFLKDWADIAADLGADFEVKDFNLTLVQCLSNNKARANNGGRFVPEEAIRNQAKRFPYPWPVITPRPNVKLNVEPYEDIVGLNSIVLCDIDGTIAQMADRSPFHWDRVGEDTPIQKVVDVVKILGLAHNIIFFSGRDGICYDQTREWLDMVGFENAPLFMRPVGDNRADFIIKYELFEREIRGKYNVAAVFDDRPAVAKLWRSMGLPLFQVGPGDSEPF